jgi:hypothetical protein
MHTKGKLFGKGTSGRWEGKRGGENMVKVHNETHFKIFLRKFKRRDSKMAARGRKQKASLL